jgi:biopolymer transport protein ExbB/TolQ
LQQFSKRLGFLNQDEDIRGIMEQFEFGALYSGAIGLFSSRPSAVAYLLIKNELRTQRHRIYHRSTTREAPRI